MNVLLTITDSYAPYCGVTIRSLIDSNPDMALDIYVVCDDLSPANAAKIKSMETVNAKIHIPVIPDWVKSELAQMRKYLVATHSLSFLYRLYATSLLPKEVDKVLYTDVDLIFNDTLGQLQNYKFRDDVSAAVVKDLVRWDDYERLNLTNKAHAYFNAGVVYINLDYWRRHDVGAKCINVLKENGFTYSMADQDALNVVLEGLVDYLHPRYNCLSPFSARREFLKARVRPEEFERVQEAVKNPAIIHYVFTNKPWFKGEYLPFRDLWLKHLANTPWAGMPIKYRGGYKGMLKCNVKKVLQTMAALFGMDYLSNIFFKKRYKHIHLMFLAMYYGIGQWLPDSFTPVFGKPSNKFRRWCCSHLFDYMGKGVNIGRRAYFGKGGGVWIGNRSNIGAYCHVPSNIIIGDKVMMGPNNYFFENVTHNFADASRPMMDQGLLAVPGRMEIGDDVWTGREVMVMPAIKIGSHSILGARCLVTKDVPEYSVMGGIPAKIIRNRRNLLIVNTLNGGG